MLDTVLHHLRSRELEGLGDWPDLRIFRHRGGNHIMTPLSEVIAKFLEEGPAAPIEESATKVGESELSREALVSLVAVRVAIQRRNDTRAAQQISTVRQSSGSRSQG